MMEPSNNKTSIFSLKFDKNNDDVEIIQEADVDIINCSGFQSEFYNCIANSFVKADQAPVDAGNKTEFFCKKCGKKYKYLALLNTHYTNCNGRRDSLQVCPTCKKTYKSMMAYKKHLLQCFQSNSAPCLADRTLCFCCEEPTKFAHTGSISCHKCSKSFRSQKGLTRHQMLLHASSVKFKCELCSVQCSNNYILKLHRQSHTDDLDRIERGSPEYKCNLCNKSYLEKTAFDIHIANHKREDTIPSITYKCNLCRLELPTLEAHNSHACESMEKTKYKCNLCGKVLSSKGFYQRHINTHKKYNVLAESDLNAQNETANDINQSKTVEAESMSRIELEFDEIFAEGERAKEEPQYLSSVSNTPSIRILNGMSMFQSDHQNESMHLSENQIFEQHIDLGSISNSVENEEGTFVVTFPMDDTTLKESVASFLQILLDGDILQEFGWPHNPVDKVIVEVLKHLGCKPSLNGKDDALRLRENVRLLIETIGDDASAIKHNDSIFSIDNVLRDIIKINSK